MVACRPAEGAGCRGQRGQRARRSIPTCLLPPTGVLAAGSAGTALAQQFLLCSLARWLARLLAARRIKPGLSRFGCRVANEIGAANVPGHADYLTFVHDLYNVWHGATGGCPPQRMSAVSPLLVPSHACGPATPVLHATAGLPTALGSCACPACQPRVTLLPLSCCPCPAAGSWGIVKTLLGMHYPNWSKVRGGGLCTPCITRRSSTPGERDSTNASKHWRRRHVVQQPLVSCFTPHLQGLPLAQPAANACAGAANVASPPHFPPTHHSIYLSILTLASVQWGNLRYTANVAATLLFRAKQLPAGTVSGLRGGGGGDEACRSALLHSPVLKSEFERNCSPRAQHQLPQWHAAPWVPPPACRSAPR